MPSSTAPFAVYAAGEWSGPQRSLLECSPFSESWPRSGLMLRGTAYALPTSAPRTGESASSSWPTARAEDSESCGAHPGAADSLRAAIEQWPTPSAWQQEESPETFNARRERLRARGYNGNGMGVPLDQYAATWPTPGAHDSEGTGRSASAEASNRSHKPHDLQVAVRVWPTPNTRDSADTARVTTTTGVMHLGVTLTDAIRLWPTPMAQDCEAAGSDRAQMATLTKAAERQWPTPRSNGDTGPDQSLREGGPTLQTAALWPTAGANDHKGAHRPGQRRGQLDAAVELPSRLSPPAPETLPPGPPSSPQGETSHPLRLNPNFVDWLMGWPPGWTACAPLETGSFRSWLDTVSSLLLSAWVSR